MDGRTPAELKNAIGLFAKPMPVAAPLNPDQSFVELVQKVSTALELAVYDQAYFDAAVFTSLESSQRCPMPFIFAVSSATVLQPADSIEWEITRLEERLEPFELAVTAEIRDGSLKALSSLPGTRQYLTSRK